MDTFEKPIIITSALPYANGPIHIGHLVEYIQTDIYVRFLRLLGKNVIYCCADDTHGSPIELKADELGIKPEELIARVYKEHFADFSQFHVSFDSYYSTNSDENKHFSDLIFRRLQEAGHIYTKEIEVMYSEKSKRFLPDRYVKGTCPKCDTENQYGDVCENCGATYKATELKNPYSVLDDSTPVIRKSVHYFFKLSSFSDFLKEWIEGNPELQPEVKKFVLNWIEKGLDDWNISRDGPYFGFKIPGEENKYYYVWLDAPIGYLSSLANYFDKDKDKALEVWNNAEITHVIGKDIIYFHCLFWPAILQAANLNVPKNVVVHGFLTVNGEKMSKSRGTFLTASDFLKDYDAEHLRYFYANVLSKKLADIDLNLGEFRERINNELVGNIGNFCYRILSFVNKNFNGEIKELDSQDELINTIKKKVEVIRDNYSKFNSNAAINEILAISDIGNKYFQDQKPWDLVKTDKAKAQQVCCLGVNIARILSIAISPVLPVFSKNLQEQINTKKVSWADIDFSLTNHQINKEQILVKKIEEKKEELFPLNLKVAQIDSVDDHPDADKLYILQVNLGSEKRQLVAGIKEAYTKDALVDKKIVIVANLKKAKLRGVESQGMLLAASDDAQTEILTVDADLGSSVSPEGLSNSESQIKYEKFVEVEFEVKAGKVYVNGKALKAGSKFVSLAKVADGAKVQ